MSGAPAGPVADTSWASAFCVRRRVAFSDTDAAGLVHFSNFLRYAEDAEHAFLRSLGHSVRADVGGRHRGWPRLRTQWRFHGPLRFEQEFEVRVLVRERRERSVTYAFELHALEGSARRLCARGTIAAGCAEGFETGEMRLVPIPADLAEQLVPAPAEAFAGWELD